MYIVNRFEAESHLAEAELFGMMNLPSVRVMHVKDPQSLRVHTDFCIHIGDSPHEGHSAISIPVDFQIIIG